MASGDQAIRCGGVEMAATVTAPTDARGTVIFAHGSGSGRYSPRNQFVAGVLNEANLATVLADLLTPEEEQGEQRGSRLRFDIGLLAERVTGIVDWTEQPAVLLPSRRGLFGASTGAAAALFTAANRPEKIRAVVSRGGRPDLAADALPRVKAPTLLNYLRTIKDRPKADVTVLGIDDFGATRSYRCSCKDSRKEALTWSSASSALPG